jgi:hypothetical protein
VITFEGSAKHGTFHKNDMVAISTNKELQNSSEGCVGARTHVPARAVVRALARTVAHVARVCVCVCARACARAYLRQPRRMHPHSSAIFREPSTPHPPPGCVCA